MRVWDILGKKIPFHLQTYIISEFSTLRVIQVSSEFC